MKTKFLLKIFYIFFVLLGMQFAYADQAEFTFIYGAYIESMGFTYNPSSSTEYTVTTFAESTQLVVNVQAKNFSGSSGQANVFNSTYGPNKMGLNTNEANADATDILVAGPLIINGNLIVGKDFALAHEHKSEDWWIATNSGSLANGDKQFDVYDTAGNYYCLSQNGTNHQVIVSKGKCGYQSYQFTFTHGTDVDSIGFIPLQSPKAGQISSIESSEANGDSTITITAMPLNSYDIASSFNSLTPLNVGCTQATNSVFVFKVYEQTFGCGPYPSVLDFYIPGYLVINGKVVSELTTGSPRVFLLAEAGNRWWLKTLNTPFEYFNTIIIINGPSYPNAVVGIYKSKNRYIYYNLTSAWDNGISVYKSDYPYE